MKLLIVGDSHAESYLPHSKIRSNAIGKTVGTPERLMQAVSGSTAIQWAKDFEVRLSRAEVSASEADATLISLLGNDLFAAAKDGKVTVVEIIASVSALFEVLRTLSSVSKRTFVLLYGQPYHEPSLIQIEGVKWLNSAIVSCAKTVSAITGNKIEFIDEDTILERSDWPGDDIHPFESGYVKIGREIMKRCGT